VRPVRYAIVVTALLASVEARAQVESWSPYSLSVYREGPGVRLGSTPLVLHPGLILEGGYDTNPFYAPAGQEVGTGLLRIRAHLDIATLPQQRLDAESTADPKVDFRFSTQLEYREYLTSIEAIKRQRSLNALVVTDLGILPRGPFTMRISDTFLRTVDPRNYELPVGSTGGQAVGTGTFSRDYNRFGALASYRPGQGKIQFGGGDYIEYSHWENPDMQQFDMIHDDVEAFFKYHFLPQTIGALVAHAGYVDFFNNKRYESAPFRVYASASSPITRWFGAYAYVGYGNSFHLAANMPSFNSAIAHVEARFFMPKGLRASIGYDRDFFDSMFAAFYTDDTGFVAFDMPLVYRLMAHLDAGVHHRVYTGLGPPSSIGVFSYDPMNTRVDLVYDFHVELSVQATQWLALSVNYNLMGDSTDFRFITCMADPTSGLACGLPGPTWDRPCR
jgi:hypothetical protein